jgi:hypothetical protein
VIEINYALQAGADPTLRSGYCLRQASLLKRYDVVERLLQDPRVNPIDNIVLKTPTTYMLDKLANQLRIELNLPYDDDCDVEGCNVEFEHIPQIQQFLLDLGYSFEDGDEIVLGSIFMYEDKYHSLYWDATNKVLIPAYSEDGRLTVPTIWQGYKTHYPLWQAGRCFELNTDLLRDLHEDSENTFDGVDFDQYVIEQYINDDLNICTRDWDGSLTAQF